MNFKQLEYFSAVAEAKSISKAARTLHIAQPPISRQIALLEDELEVCLFRRTNKGVELTQAGQSLYQQSQHIFQNLRAIVDSVRDVNTGLRGLLKLGSIYSNIPVLMRVLKAYHRQYPDVELYIQLGAPTDLLEELNKGNLHLLFLRTPVGIDATLERYILGEDPLELVMTPQLDPAPEEAEVPMDRLRDCPMCLLRSDDLWGYSSYLIGECRRRGFSPNLVCQCYDAPMAIQLVQANFGISFLPRSVLETHPNSELYAKPIRELHVQSNPTLHWNQNLYHSGCVKSFLHMVQQEWESAPSVI